MIDNDLESLKEELEWRRVVVKDFKMLQDRIQETRQACAVSIVMNIFIMLVAMYFGVFKK